MTAEADEAWMVWLTSAELANMAHVALCENGMTDRRHRLRWLARLDFEAWIDALIVGMEG